MTQSLLKKLGLAALAALVVWLLSRYLLPILLPFLLAAVLALAAEPLVRVFRRRLHLPQWAAAGLGVSVALLMAALTVAVLLAFLIRELGQLAAVVPDLEGSALQGMASLENFLLDMAARTPDSVSPLLTGSVEKLFSDGTDLVDGVSSGILKMASGAVTRLPDGALSIGTWLIASFMISARLPKLRQRFREKLPASWREQYLPAVKRVRKFFSGWLLAQLKLCVITALVLCAGFLLLRVTYAPLWAALVALLDALPVLGTGMILVPWSVVCFLQGSYVRAIGLLGTYAVAAVLRSVLEPRLVGRQLGLDPLVTLLAMYAGYRLWGLAGMILSPMLAVAAFQLFTSRREEES